MIIAEGREMRDANATAGHTGAQREPTAGVEKDLSGPTAPPFTNVIDANCTTDASQRSIAVFDRTMGLV